MVRSKTLDTATNKINNVIRAVYAYRYEGKAEDLKVEKGKIIGFESRSLEKISDVSDEDRKRFIPSILKEENLKIFKVIQELI